ERVAPHLMPKDRHEIAQTTQPIAVSLELAPQAFTPPDAHAVGVRKRRRGTPPIVGNTNEGGEQALPVGSLARPLTRGAYRAKGDLVFEQQRVVEVEEQR